MDKEKETQVLDFISTDILNNLNLSGVVNACKWFCFEHAKQKVQDLTEEQKEEIYQALVKAEKDASTQESPSVQQ